jgi:predicted dinucleotide-binding enzyme
MKIGVLGTGMVGQQLARKLVGLGHEVMMGARSRENEKAAAFVSEAGEGASAGTFEDAVRHADQLILNCTAGAHAVAAVEAGGADHYEGKILIDVSNPLDFSNGFPPSLSVMNDDSLAEQLQRAVPAAKVVKALNTVANEVMVDPGKLADGEHDLFVCGDDDDAKGVVVRFLKEQFGWKHVHDLGALSHARGTEAWLLLWTRMYAAFGTGEFNIHVVKNG